ncbi:MAG: adenylate/guanylate cyclase domain-containing protein [Acidimicrobiia bacterium]|nr:adenylate/guanylate cyclase domain-containing protein [Acidimicrobiia bacterium]
MQTETSTPDGREPDATGAIPTADAVDRVIAFTDLVRSTELLAACGDRRWLQIINEHDRRLGVAAQLWRGRIVKFQGDGSMATFIDARDAVDWAFEVVDEIAPELGLECRAGVHAGPVLLQRGDCFGLTVHVASRLADRARPNEVLVSATTFPASAPAQSTLGVREVELRGLPGAMSAMSCTSRKAASLVG